MNMIQKAQHPTGGYGFKSATTSDLSHNNAVRLIKLKEYALSLGLCVEANINGLHLDIVDSKTREPIAKTIAI